MNPWLETLGVVFVALLGAGVGKAFSNLKKSYWMLGYFLPLLLIVMLVLDRFGNEMNFLPPFSWIAAGRAKFVIFSLAATMGLTTPLSRLPRRIEKLAICILMVVVVVWFSILPFLVPAIIKNHLSTLPTRMDSSGVCFQTTDYTCGPAAAVTALAKLGLTADEGEIAILSHTSPIIGTIPDCLSRALQNRYGSEGLECRYRSFNSVDQLKDNPVTLAVVRDRFLLDHCVAVLKVSDYTVVLADPAFGKVSMSREQFEKVWRFSGIVLKRNATPSI